MKKISSIICVFLLAITTEAQTIHWLTFIDTTDPNVGQIDVYGRQMLYSYFINEVNSALKPKGYKSDIQDFYAQNVSPENCKEAVESLTIDNPDDIIVFYYIGHGVRPASDSDYMDLHPYPQMCMAQHDERKFIPLEWIDEQLSSKGARLSVTIGMCCNNMNSNVTIKEEPEFNPNYGPTYMSNNKVKRIQELFLNERGHIIATSASPMQTSGCFQIYPSPFPNPAFYRDRYSYAICSFFQTQLDNYSKPLTWDDFLTSISWFVDKYSDHEQTPFHDIYPSEECIATPETTPRVIVEDVIDEIIEEQNPNSSKKQGDIDSRQWINELTEQLGYLINVSLGEEKRIELEIALNELFTKDAIVKFLAQDSEQVIDKEEASVFLGRLATSRLLLNVVVLEGEFDSSNKIKNLKVREVYRK